MQENFFFREPETQKKLLDILFIYSKLNPDTGYRQGMHEVLAPILWVVNQDALDVVGESVADKQKEGVDFMKDVINRAYVEQDTFNLFCAVMQTTKAFYETGDNRDSSPIIRESKRIQDELLATFDPELTLHLQVVGVLPQIYAIRWIRLLFGREFEFKEVLWLWDMVFAENVRSDIISMTCVAMLLRLRWTLIEADYPSAITSLSRYDPPDKDEDPRNLVRDALYLEKNMNIETGASFIQKYSGRRPKAQKLEEPTAARLRAEHTPVRGSRAPQLRPSPSPSPAKFTTPQKQLEALFLQVSGGIQQRAEGWNVSKAVKGAVGEVRRNVNNFQTSHSRGSSVDILLAGNETPRRNNSQRENRTAELEKRMQDLEARNKALSKMLDSALSSLRSTKPPTSDGAEEAFNISLAKIQFVSVYLADSDIPIPPENTTTQNDQQAVQDISKPEDPQAQYQDEQSKRDTDLARKPSPKAVEIPVKEKTTHLTPSPKTDSVNPSTRPSLANSSFSFMLGENRRRSSFVSSVTDPPEQRRGSDAKPTKPKQLKAEEKEAKERRGSETEDDGFTMNRLHGGQRE